MKVWGITMIAAAVFSAAAGERETLQKAFENESAAAETEFQAAETTVSMTAAAGMLYSVAEKQLLRALDYKLRHTPSEPERLRILSDFLRLGKLLQKVLGTSRQDLGSGAGLRIYCTAANMMQRQIDILMLDKVSGQRWNRIADAVLILDEKKKIGLKHGTASFNTVMYGRKVTLTAVLWPKDTFCFRGRDFAVITTDLLFSGTDDYSNVYLCELKSGNLFIHTVCRFPTIVRWNLQGRLFVFCTETESQETEL